MLNETMGRRGLLFTAFGLLALPVIARAEIRNITFDLFNPENDPISLRELLKKEPLPFAVKNNFAATAGNFMLNLVGVEAPWVYGVFMPNIQQYVLPGVAFDQAVIPGKASVRVAAASEFSLKWKGLPREEIPRRIA